MSSLLLKLPGKLRLANLPTPVQRLAGLSSALRRDVYIKRDDLTGCAASGNKIRKLEYVLHEALQAGAQTVITPGALHSNHCRATAVACRRAGLDPYLILRRTAEPEEVGNLFLDLLMGARVRIVEPEDYYERLDEIAAEIGEAEEEAGRKAFYVPVGASNETGSLGYYGCAEEIADWQQTTGVEIDRIYFAAGSGGTSAGLLMGAVAFGLKARIRAINVGEPHDEFVREIERICRGAAERFGQPGWSPPAPEVVEGYCGEGYGQAGGSVYETIRALARSDGIVLDPVYTGKAMLGLTEEERKLPAGGSVLFIHTGGIFGLLSEPGDVLGETGDLYRDR